MNRSYSKIRHIQESNILLEKRRFNQLVESRISNYNRIINEEVKMPLKWVSCGGDETELTDESKLILQLGDKIGDKQLYYFSSEPKDKVGEFQIMDCLGPEINKRNDLEIETQNGVNYLYKHY